MLLHRKCRLPNVPHESLLGLSKCLLWISSKKVDFQVPPGSAHQNNNNNCPLFQVFKRLSNGETWMTSGMFPRVTFCDVPIRAVGQPYTRTIQCVLPVNMINEKLFVFLWFWILICLFMAMVSLIYWFVVLALQSQKNFRSICSIYLRHVSAANLVMCGCICDTIWWCDLQETSIASDRIC